MKNCIIFLVPFQFNHINYEVKKHGFHIVIFCNIQGFQICIETILN